jgi:hypothetical protein
VLSAGGEPDDPAPRAATGSVPPGELRDQEGRRHRVDRELLPERLRGHLPHRPPEPVDTG